MLIRSNEAEFLKSFAYLIEIALALQLTGAVYTRLHTPISLKGNITAIWPTI